MLQMVNQFSTNIQQAIEGSGVTVSTDSLTVGAKINKLFHERLPIQIAERKIEEKTLRREIKVVIQNTRGVRSGLFTPDMAFERIVKERIEELLTAPLNLVDNVTNEILESSKLCAQHMSAFPMLHQEVERIVNDHIREKESLCRTQVELQVNFELAYINTNHEDFIGFHNAASSEKSRKKTGMNQVIRRGFMSIDAGGGIKKMKGNQFWFVLNAESFSWYKSDAEQDKKYMIPMTDDLKVKSEKSESMFGNTTIKFTLFSNERKNIYQNSTKLDLIVGSDEELESWKAAFLRAGVYPESQSATRSTQEDDDIDGTITGADPQLERQVEQIRNLVDSYMQIIMRTFKDMTPKLVMHMLVNETKNFIADELLACLYQQCDMSALTEEAPEEAERRDELLKLHASLKEAMKIINDFTASTQYQAPPPAVDSSWVASSKSSAATRPPLQRQTSKPSPKAPPKPPAQKARPRAAPAPPKAAPQLTPQQQQTMQPMQAMQPMMAPQQSMMQQQPMMPQTMNMQMPMPTMQQAQQGMNLMNQISSMGQMQNQTPQNNSNPLDFFK